MKPLAECLELIQGKKLEEFIKENPHPVLIGLGVIGGDLQSNPKKVEGTMFVNLSAMLDPSDDTSQVNQVYNVEKTTSHGGITEIYVGSAEANDIHIEDKSLSKTHAHFLLSDGVAQIVDHGSTNGSFVNGARIDAGIPAPLKGGDILTLGRLSYTYYDASSFAKLLTVQAMARGRSRKLPRTPGTARSSGTQRLGPSIRPGGQPAAAPWAKKPRISNIRRTSVVPTPAEPAPWQPGGEPQTPEWRERAIGRPPPQRDPSGAGAPSSGQHRPSPGQPQLPAVLEPRGWFARLLLRFSRWLQKLAGVQ